MADNIIGMVPVDPEDRMGVPYNPQPYMVEHPCERCGRNGYIGPRQLGFKASDPSIPVLCMVCVMDDAKAVGFMPNVQNLGGA